MQSYDKGRLCAEVTSLCSRVLYELHKYLLRSAVRSD